MSNMTFREMHEVLYNELRLMHYPIAVKFFFEDEELEGFKGRADEYHVPVKPMTFCQWEIAARMKGQTVLALPEHLGCPNARFCFGWKDLDDKEIKSHAKYVKDLEQAERFVRTKPRLPLNALKAIVVAPLFDACFEPDTVHFYCDNMQAYHLAVDWMSATDNHPMQPSITMNSSACGGNVWSYLEQKANMLPSCSGAYNAGKTERGEINFILPGKHVPLVVERMLERKTQSGSCSVTRPGDGFPGADVCKNCPLIVFKKEKGE